MIKQSNNAYSNNFLIKIQLNTGVSKVKEELETWVIQECLDKLNDPITIQYKDEEHIQYNWHIISRTLHNNYYDEEYNITKNEIYFAIHFKNNDIYENIFDDSLIYDELKNDNITTNANKILQCFDNKNNIPKYITGIGVSGLSDKIMSRLWFEMVAIEQHMDGEYKGYMVHPMWMKLPDGSWITIRENSYNFGWDNYNHK